MPDPGGQSHVFVVDDESSIATTLALILRSQGFDARAFTELLEALEAASVDASDLLLSDVMMPMLNGFELGVRISKKCPQCKVLLFSGHPGITEMRATDQVEGFDFEVLAKPVHPAETLSAVQRVLRGGTATQ